MIALFLVGAAHAQDYRFPTSSADYGSFYPTAYYDHNAAAGGIQDWNCSNLTYDGHRGSDFGVGGFPGMDSGMDIVAAADGTVVYTEDGWDDRCTTGNCAGGGGFGNYVKIRHADGKETIYGHMKKFSVAVALNDVVSCGDIIGQVGSSGYSTGPHLHFEPRAGNVADDPFAGACSHAYDFWVGQGAHGGLPDLTCDGVVQPPAVLDLSLANVISGQVGVATITGADPGDTVVLYWSRNPGPGLCPQQLGGQCLDVGTPTWLIDTGVANAQGVAVIRHAIGQPRGTPYYAQAAVAAGANSLKSDVDTGSVR